MLDVASTELNPLGYNHNSFKSIMHGSGSDCSIINGAACDQIASLKFADKVENAMGSITPSGLRGITLTSSSNSSQDAVNHSILMKGANEESHHMHTLSFEGSSHSNFGFNDSLTHQVPYPLTEQDESIILEQVRSTLLGTGCPFAAILVEPTQQSTGRTVSDSFIDSLNGIASDFDASLVVDETGTAGGASGRGFF